MLTETRNNCKFCRLKRCVEAGMDPDKICHARAAAIESRRCLSAAPPRILPTPTQME